MPDPLSITTGVLALLSTVVTVANELKKLHDGAAVVHTTISELENDVNGLARVLETMRSTFEGLTAENGTGHIGDLWDNVAKSIDDGKRIIRQLAALIEEVNTEQVLGRAQEATQTQPSGGEDPQLQNAYPILPRWPLSFLASHSPLEPNVVSKTSRSGAS